MKISVLCIFNKMFYIPVTSWPQHGHTK